jgi:hypothetical protein
MQLLVTAYPTTFFGKTVKTELGIGFTQHYYAEPVPCTTEPNPLTSSEPTIASNGKYKISIEPVPCKPVEPTAEPMITPTGEMSPTPTSEPSASATSSP